MIKRIIRLSVAILAITLSVGPFQGTAQTLQDSLKRIDSAFTTLNEQTPGAVLTISRRGNIIYSKAFGMADLEHSIPASTQTIFEAGSVSKQFTATSLLLLVRAGKVNLEDDVRKYIPELPKYEHVIKVRHLLNHTSGIKDWGVLAGVGGWPRGSRVYTNDRALEYIVKQSTLNNQPGDEYIYSNSNYTLITFIVERVSGEKLPEFTRKNIFEPLKMTNTKWRDNFKSIVKNRAIGYDKSKDVYVTDLPFENTYGHAALLTTTTDLDIWNTSWKNSPLGGNDLLQLRTEQGILNNGEKISYASAVMIDDYNGHPAVTHSGATAGYRAWLAYYPKDELSVVYLSNNGIFSTTGVGNTVAKVFFGDKPVKKPAKKPMVVEYKPDVASLSNLAGKYYSKECEGEYTVKIVNGSVRLSRKHEQTVILKPVSKDKFTHGEQIDYEFKRKGSQVDQMLISVSRARNILFERTN